MEECLDGNERTRNSVLVSWRGGTSASFLKVTGLCQQKAKLSFPRSMAGMTGVGIKLWFARSASLGEGIAFFQLTPRHAGIHSVAEAGVPRRRVSKWNYGLSRAEIQNTHINSYYSRKSQLAAARRSFLSCSSMGTIKWPRLPARISAILYTVRPMR